MARPQAIEGRILHFQSLQCIEVVLHKGYGGVWGDIVQRNPAREGTDKLLKQSVVIIFQLLVDTDLVILARATASRQDISKQEWKYIFLILS